MEPTDDLVERQAFVPFKNSQLLMKGGKLPIPGDIQGDIQRSWMYQWGESNQFQAGGAGLRTQSFYDSAHTRIYTSDLI